MLTWKPYTAAKLLLLAAVLFAIVLVAGVLFAIVALFALLAPIAANLVIGEVTDLQQMLVWMTLSIRTSTTSFLGPPIQIPDGRLQSVFTECRSSHNM